MTSAVRRTGFDRSRLDKVFRPRGDRDVCVDGRGRGLGGEVNVNLNARPLVVLPRLRGNVSGQRGE